MIDPMPSPSTSLPAATTAMGLLVLLSMTLLAGCQSPAKVPEENMKKHCATAAQVRADRHLNMAQRRQVSAAERARAIEAFERRCLEEMKRQHK
ncbi:MAG: hypothetical protein R3229_01770 [Alphaproteobacteria bacterium]|nr:hypothetical protein [Alphaproteobacteria bacterium]